jgi:hypothetical protein
MITGPMPGPDGLLRCPWALSATEYLAYHDNEWGRPVTSVQGLAPLSGVAALLAGWTLMGVAFLLLGVALVLGVLRRCWSDGHPWGLCSCGSGSRRCWAVSRSCTVLNCRGGWWRG